MRLRRSTTWEEANLACRQRGRRCHLEFAIATLDYMILVNAVPFSAHNLTAPHHLGCLSYYTSQSPCLLANRNNRCGIGPFCSFFVHGMISYALLRNFTSTSFRPFSEDTT